MSNGMMLIKEILQHSNSGDRDSYNDDSWNDDWNDDCNDDWNDDWNDY